jgi:hypothetical protein
MTEERYRRYELILKALAPVLTVAGILLGVWEFQAGERNQRERDLRSIAIQDSLEFKRKIWEQQLSVYRDLSNTIGQIASSTNTAAFGTAAAKFEEMYWGAAVFTEDREVEQSLHKVHLALRDFREGRLQADQLRLVAASAVETLRNSLDRSWTDLQRPRT